jgi:AraC-like DNA-binding protein
MPPVYPTLEAPVITVLDPDERARVDAAGEGLYQTIHRESVADALQDLKRGHAGAVLVVREFPTVPTVALLSNQPPTAEALLRLGNAGITRLVDVRVPAGWSQLRRILASEASRATDRIALARIREELAPVPDDTWLFFDALFAASARSGTVADLSRRMQVLPSTLMSRFFRARLPAPKRYLAYARLLRAARLFEDAGHSIADVANALDFSSPQSFGRHVQTFLGIGAAEFRREYSSDAMLERFLNELVRPHRETLRRLRALALRPGMRPAVPPSVADRTPAVVRRIVG